MSKLVRNSIFTLVVLALTAFGLSWNKNVALRSDPVQISNTVLSAETNKTNQPFPLTVEFAKSRLKLGQYQELKIKTIAKAKLEIVTVYPTGSVNNPQTLETTADETGRYTIKFKLDDFALLGLFETRVLARSNNAISQDLARFTLQSWTPDEQVQRHDGYIYPLVP